MGEEDIWVGIDLGTQGARALAVTSSGSVAGRGSQPLPSRRDGDRHEQDPDDWWTATAAACRESLEGIAGARVKGVAVDGTSATVLLVDAGGAPVTPGLMYDDARAGDQARRAEMPPAWGLPKLMWLLEQREDEPECRLAHQPDVIARKLVGHVVPSDASHALKSGYDVERDAWPHERLGRLGVPAEALPEVVRPGARLGEVCEAGAGRTGIPPGTPVVAGMTDSCAAQVAAGALREGSWNSALGTTLALKGASPQLIRDPNGVLYCHRGPDGGWLPGGASSSGAGALDNAFPDRDLDELTERAAEHEATGAIAYPLVSRGERFPFQAPEAEPFTLGEPRDDGEHLAALFEGLACVERLCFDYVDMLGAPTGGELGFTGGTARNRHLCALRADMLGREVSLPETAESAFGMAVLAASAGGSTAEAAEAMVRVRERIEPRPERLEAHLECYLQLVDELERRGWLGDELAGHARARAQ